MSLLGFRGTLRDFEAEQSIKGNFYGKTGTLTGVRAVSGILETPNRFRYVSIISNGATQPNRKIAELLDIVNRGDKCI